MSAKLTSYWSQAICCLKLFRGPLSLLIRDDARLVLDLVSNHDEMILTSFFPLDEADRFYFRGTGLLGHLLEANVIVVTSRASKVGLPSGPVVNVAVWEPYTLRQVRARPV